VQRQFHAFLWLRDRRFLFPNLVALLPNGRCLFLVVAISLRNSLSGIAFTAS